MVSAGLSLLIPESPWEETGRRRRPCRQGPGRRQEGEGGWAGAEKQLLRC